MNVKLLVMFVVCALVVIEARPGREKGKGGERGQGKKSDNTDHVKPDNSSVISDKIIPLTLKALEDLCNGLSSGNITNDNSSYDAVFVNLDSVCSELAAYLATQTPTPVDPAAPVDPAVPGGRRKRGARPAGGRPGGPRPAQPPKPESAESAEDDQDSREERFGGNEAVARLFKICKGLERLLPNLPADTPVALTSLLTNTGGVCAEARLVRNPA